MQFQDQHINSSLFYVFRSICDTIMSKLLKHYKKTVDMSQNLCYNELWKGGVNVKRVKFGSNFKYLLFDFICTVALLLVCIAIVLLQVLSQRFNWVFTAAGAVTFIFMLIELLSFLGSWQTVYIEDGKIFSRSIWGTVETLALDDVQSSRLKKITIAKIAKKKIRRQFIIVSTNEQQGKVEGCYAESEGGYVVIPNTPENLATLQEFLSLELPE